MSHSRAIFIVAFIFYVTSCKHLSNSIQTSQLDCGSDFKSSDDYFKVISVSGKTLKSYEFEAFKLDKYTLTQLPVSSRACVPASSTHSIIVRSKFDDTSALIDPTTQVLKKSVELKKFSDLAASIACESNVKARVRPKELVARIFSYNQESAPINVTRVTVAFASSDMKQESFTLTNAIQSDRTFEFLSEGSTHRMTISIENLMKRDSVLKRECIISVDDRAPEVELQINSSIPSNTIEWQGTKAIPVLEDNDAISIESIDGDVSYAEFCSVKLNDDFSSDDALNSNLWTKATNLSSCPKFERIAVGQRILPNTRGFWSIIFRARDHAGNISLTTNKTVFLRSSGKVELIKTKAKISTRNSIAEKRYEEAVINIVDLESKRRELPTRLEREQVKKFLIESALTLLLTPNLSLNLQIVKGEPFGEIFRFGPISGDLIAYLPGQKVVFWDGKTGAEKRSFAITKDDSLRGMDISHDEKRILLNYRSRFEVWMKVDNTYIFERSLAAEDRFDYVYFANDSQSIVANTDHTVKVLNSEDLGQIVELNTINVFNGIIALAAPTRSANLYYVNDALQIVKYNFLTKESTILKTLPTETEINSIAVSPDEKTLIYGDKVMRLFHLNLETSEQVEFLNIGTKTNISWIGFSSDSSSFVTVGLSAEIVVRRTGDGTVLNIINDFESPAYQVRFHSKAKILAASTRGGLLKLWSLEDLVTTADASILSQGSLKWLNDDTFDYGSPADESNRISVISVESGANKLVDLTSVDVNKKLAEGLLEPLSFDWCLASEKVTKDWWEKCWEKFPALKSNYVISEDGSILVSTKLSTFSFIRTSDYKILAQKDVEHYKHFSVSRDGKVAFLLTYDALMSINTSDGSLNWSIELESPWKFWTSADQSFLIVSLGDYSGIYVDINSGKEKGRFSWQTQIYGGNVFHDALTNTVNDLMITFHSGNEVRLWDNSEKVFMLRLKSNGLCRRLIMNSSGSRVACQYAIGNENHVEFWDLDFDRSLKKVCALSQKTRSDPVCKTP